MQPQGGAQCVQKLADPALFFAFPVLPELHPISPLQSIPFNGMPQGPHFEGLANSPSQKVLGGFFSQCCHHCLHNSDMGVDSAIALAY